MTLDEAIKHAEEVAEENEHDATIWKKTKQTKEIERCEKCAEEHRQLAEWLKDYKKLLESSSETKIDCDNADCNNCVNHKYCDYESNKSEISTGSIHCQHTDAEIAKSFIEDVAAAKDQLPGGDQMDFPNTFDEFAKDYGFKDKDEVYTNGSELIPVFRVRQWLEHISTAKNNLAVEDEERTLALLYLEQIKEDYIEGEGYERHPLPEYYAIEKAIKTLAMPLVTPQKTKTENDFAVDPIDRVELLRAMDTWDKFGFTTRYGLERLDKDDKGFVPYVKYDDMLKCVKGMSSVTLQESKTGHWIRISPTEIYECSECGQNVMTSDICAYKFCHGCGAIMVEPQESEE